MCPASQARHNKEITHSVWNTGNLEWILLKLKHGKYWVVDLGITQSEKCLAPKHNTWHPQRMKVTIITAQQAAFPSLPKEKLGIAQSTWHLKLGGESLERAHRVGREKNLKVP